jgi:hypothetical protein
MRRFQKARLVDDWRSSHRWWSVRAAVFWGALNGAVTALSAFSDNINPWLFLGLNVVGYATIGLARLLKQPGLD